MQSIEGNPGATIVPCVTKTVEKVIGVIFDWGRFSFEYFSFPCQLYHKFSILIYHQSYVEWWASPTTTLLQPQSSDGASLLTLHVAGLRIKMLILTCNRDLCDQGKTYIKCLKISQIFYIVLWPLNVYMNYMQQKFSF